METPCDYGECPFGAYKSDDCRHFCGLGCDEACGEELVYDEERECFVRYEDYVEGRGYDYE